jgi:carbonic anhydrase
MANKIWYNLRYDLPSGVVVFLIALPLCLGIALASGAPLMSGLIAGIVGGLVTGILSGSSFSVSGPAAGLTAIVLVAIQQLGNFEVFLCALVMAGLIQLIFGFLRAGIITAYIPGNVIKGMLTAIGIIIIMKQIPHAFGYDADSEGDFSFIEANGSNTIYSFLEPLAHIHTGAMIIALVSMAILLLWERPFMKKLKAIPGPLVAVLAGVALNRLFAQAGGKLALAGKQLVNIPSFDLTNISSVLVFPDFSYVTDKHVIATAFTIAIVASIETLLNLEAVDKLDPHKRTSPANRELKAQGVGNIVSGLLGGLPVTSVIVRSSANVNAGARSKASAVVHGLLLLVCTLSIPGLLNQVPLASLAAILLLTGYKLTKLSVFKEMFAKGKYQWIPFLVTVVAIVFTDLLTGVLTGLAVSAFAILMGNMKMPYYFHSKKYHEGEMIHIELAPEVSFLNRASIKLTLDKLPGNSTVWIDASNSSYIDYDVLELVREFRDVKAPDKGIDLYITGFKDKYMPDLPGNHVMIEKLKDIKFEMYHGRMAKPFIQTN